MLLGAAQPEAASAPPTAAPVAAACPIDVMAVMPLPGNGITATFAAILASPAGGGVASGTIWVNTSMGPFHVPFAQRAVIGKPYTAGDDPIVFAIPAAATLDNAFVDALTGAEPCAKPGFWAPPYNALLGDTVKRAVAASMKTAESPVSATSISDPAAACHVPDTPAFVVTAAEVHGAPDLQGGTVKVRVHLAADSSVASATVDDPNSPVRYYNTRALAAARASIYVTAMQNCRAVESDYLFSAVFP